MIYFIWFDYGKLDKLYVLQHQIAYYQHTLSFSLLVKSIEKVEFQPPVRFAQNLTKFWLLSFQQLSRIIQSLGCYVFLTC